MTQPSVRLFGRTLSTEEISSTSGLIDLALNRDTQPMELAKDTVYLHEEHGEVLVLAVHHVFETYDLEKQGGQPHSRVVRYTTDWDGYGPIPASVQTAPVEKFQNAIGDPIRTADFTAPEDAVRSPE